MAQDFTLHMFERFCRCARNYPVFTLADYLSQPVPPDLPYVIFRVDVDYREQHAVQLAGIAARYGLHGSFYFRCHDERFPLDALRAVAALGHEVGYHFETLDTCRGDFEAASARFLQHISVLRQSGFEICTVAAHGNRPAAPNYRSNLDLLRQRPELFQRANLLGETTLSIDFAQVIYVSDAGWRWLSYPCYEPGAKGQPTSLLAVTRAFPGWSAGLYINFHPQHWFAHPARMIYFRQRQLIRKWIRWQIRRIGI